MGIVGLCEKHVAMLENSLVQHGLDAYSSHDPAETAKRFMSRMSGPTTLSNFDPLASAQMVLAAFSAQLVHQFGESIYDGIRPDEERCMLCFAQAAHDRQCEKKDCPPVDIYIDKAMEREVDVLFELSHTETKH